MDNFHILQIVIFQDLYKLEASSFCVLRYGNQFYTPSYYI